MCTDKQTNKLDVLITNLIIITMLMIYTRINELLKEMKGTRIKQVYIPQVNAFYWKHGQWYLQTCTKLLTRYGQNLQ